MANEQKPVKVVAELFWANFMNTFNTRFNQDNEKYEACLGNLSDKACQVLKDDFGIKIKDRDPMGKHIVGKSKHVFKVVDTEGNPVPIEKIGNGTKVIALVSSYSHKMSKQHGNAPSIGKIIVTELKTYDPEGALAEEVEEAL
jgi:hypothetical protein